jgi:Flp pilus assembly protein CpaB
MRRGRVFFFIAFILILGLVGVLLAWRFMGNFLGSRSQQGPLPTPTLPPVEVVVMAQNVTKGNELQEPMLTTIPWQQSAIAPGMYTSDQLPELIGKVPKYDLSAGTPLLEAMLLKPGETISSAGSPWALSIPPGMVAVAVPVTRLSSVAYAPRPGDHVNVIATLLFTDLDTDFQTVLPNSLGELVLTGPPDPETGQPTIVFSSKGTGLFGKIVIDPVWARRSTLFRVNRSGRGWSARCCCRM